MQKIILITTMLLALIISSCALPEEPETEIKTIKEIKVVESYYQSPRINDIADDDQFIWCATDDGVVRIDKVTNEKKLYNSKNSPFSSAYGITIGSNNTVWVNTYNKIYFKITNSESWQTVQATNLYANKILTDSQNNLWILSNYKLYKYTNNTFQQLDTTGSVRLVTIDRINNIWFCTADSINHLKKYDGNQITSYQLPDTLKKTDLNSIAVNNNQEIAIGTSYRGIAIFNQTNWQIYNSNNSSLPYNNAYRVKGDATNNFWFLQSSQTVIKLSSSGEITNYNTTNSPYEQITTNALHCDREGRMLVGAYQCYDTKNLLIYSDNAWQKSSCILYPQPTSIKDMLTDKHGNVWLAGSYGITKISNGNWQFYLPEDTVNQVIGLDYINSMIEDRSGNIWFGTNGGVIKYDGSKFSYYTYQNSSLPENKSCTIGIDDQGNISATTFIYNSSYNHYNYIYKFDGTSWNSGSNTNIDNSGITKNCGDWLLADYVYEKNYYGIYTRFNLSNSPLSKVSSLDVDNSGNPWFVTVKDDRSYVYLQRYSRFFRYDWKNMGFDNNNNDGYYKLKNDKQQGLTVYYWSRLALKANESTDWQPYTINWNNIETNTPQNLCWQNSKTLWLTDGNRLFKAEVQE